MNPNVSPRQFRTENQEYIQGMREIRKSNKAGTHLDARFRRARTRLDSKRKSIQESQDNG